MTMKTMKIGAAVAALLLLAAAAGFADGAGGVTHGMQYLDLEQWCDVDPGWYAADLGLITAGGFGWGANRRGERVGGFGLALYSDDPSIGLAGGVGGLINGQQVSIGPFTAAAVAWTGVGCLTVDAPVLAGSWVVAFAEVDLEASWAVLPWLQLTGYAGLQVMGNVTGGRPFDEFLFWTPVVGARIAWGSF
jgi:hypothetical protein